jgi:hypothetical protein
VVSLCVVRVGLLLPLVLVVGMTGVWRESAAALAGGPPPPAKSSQTAPSAAAFRAGPTWLAEAANGPPMSPAPAPSPPKARPNPGRRVDGAASVETHPPRSRVPSPYNAKTTTNPVLDASRSTIMPDRDALPHALQDVPVVEYGPAPPDLTPTREQGGPTRVQAIQPQVTQPTTSAAPTSGAPASTPAGTSLKPPGAPVPDPRRTP